eukprot:gnl/MRDRNA2_/MRDRNA2_75143_c0_seq1.p1 gnl/MRDRNA2_/MRDRNA2_75143_c0~~gnl/MRDRNA2_/MRDRNA2_75143_c0_seq1.p1  ORF type:complete len:341 (-),score=47.64 gnl/MRDRNA2_/MRDRNA2_75143_c0_seq1:376-1398(-)
MSLSTASRPGSAKRSSSAAASVSLSRSRIAQNTGSLVLKSFPNEHAVQGGMMTLSKAQCETLQSQVPRTPNSRGDRSGRLPSITAAPRRSSNLWDTVCLPALLSSDIKDPDLAKLRLYFKGLNLKPEQINRVHPETKWTFLHHFAHQGDEELVSWGLRAGADYSVKNAMGKTPLHLAAESNKPMVVLTLLQGGADVHSRTLAGYTPLHLAVLNRNKLAVRALLANSVVPVDVAADSAHGTPFDLTKDPEIHEMLREYSLNGFLKSPTSKSKRLLRLSSSSLSQELSEHGSAVPTPKSTRILLQPLLPSDAHQLKVIERQLSSDAHQFKAIERQLTGLSCV